MRHRWGPAKTARLLVTAVRVDDDQVRIVFQILLILKSLRTGWKDLMSVPRLLARPLVALGGQSASLLYLCVYSYQVV